MKVIRISAFLLIFIVVLTQISCSQRKAAAPDQSQNQSEQDKSKGYIIYINSDKPEKNVMYNTDVGGKKKQKSYDKDMTSAVGYNEKIAFISKESDKQGLSIINADGSGIMQVIGDVSIKSSSISWSPDGKKLTFSARQPADKSEEIYYVEVGKNRTPVKLTDDINIDESPKFSSDGKNIIYTKIKNNDYDICKVDIAAQNETDISNNSSNDMSPSSFPDGTKIVFLSDEKEKGKYNLFMMDMDGGSRTELTSGLNIVRDTIRISPDSSMVAFVTTDERKNNTVQIIDMNKTTIMIADDAYLASWSNDSKMLYYATYDPKNRRIVEYDIAGKAMKDVVKVEYKPGEESTGIKFLHFTSKLK